MSDVKLKAVRSAGFTSGWVWTATINGGARTLSATGVYSCFMAGDSVDAVSKLWCINREHTEAILRAMMKRKRR